MAQAKTLIVQKLIVQTLSVCFLLLFTKLKLLKDLYIL